MYAEVYFSDRDSWTFYIPKGTFKLIHHRCNKKKEEKIYAIYFAPVWGLYIGFEDNPSKNLNGPLRVQCIKFIDDSSPDRDFLYACYATGET